MKHIRLSAITFLVILLCTAASTRADGCFFVYEQVGQSGSISSSRQEAMLITDNESVQVILRTHFRAGPTELAWVVPVPAEPREIRALTDDVFAKMDDLTAPQFFEQVYRGKGWACGCSAGGDQYGEEAVEPRVKVVKSGEAGMYEYVVLAADDGDALMNWLNRHQYRVPAAAGATFEHYAKMKWHWLAMRVRAAASAAVDAGNAAPQPITYTYSSDKLVFPLVISRVSATVDNEIVLHVVAKHRAFTSGEWKNATVDGRHIEWDPAAPSGTSYARVLARLCETADGRMFVTEYAQRWGPYIGETRGEALAGLSQTMMAKLGKEMFITRLRAVVPPGAMDRDVELLPWNHPEDSPNGLVGNHFVLPERRMSGPVSMLPVALAAAALSCGFIGRSKRGRAVAVIACGLLLCMI